MAKKKNVVGQIGIFKLVTHLSLNSMQENKIITRYFEYLFIQELFINNIHLIQGNVTCFNLADISLCPTNPSIFSDNHSKTTQ